MDDTLVDAALEPRAAREACAMGGEPIEGLRVPPFRDFVQNLLCGEPAFGAWSGMS